MNTKGYNALPKYLDGKSHVFRNEMRSTKLTEIWKV